MALRVPPRPQAAFSLTFDEPLRLTPHGLRWRSVRLALASLVAVMTLLFVFMTAAAFPAKVAGGGWAWTTRTPLAAGIPTQGETVLVSDTLAGLRANTRVFESIFRSHSVMKIVGVPGDRLEARDGILYVNGETTGYPGQVTGGQRLSAKYLVLCVSGKCTPGKVEMIPTTNVLGKVASVNLAVPAQGS